VLYGEATETEREAFETHRRSCEACADEYAAFTSVREELRAWEVDAIPHIRLEVRPRFLERLRRAFALMPLAARLAAASACALLVLAVVNTEVTVGSGEVSIHVGLWPRPAAAAEPRLTEEDMRRIVEERVDATVRSELAAYRGEMDTQLRELETRLASATSADDVRRLTVQVATQRKRIEQLQRDVDRTAGYGGDLFGAVMSPREPGS
jgi:hypothetical protein